MMRKIFAAAMVLSLTGAVVLGGILAFRSSQTTNEFTAKIGNASWAIAYETEPNTIVPGYPNEVVGEGYLASDPGSSFALINTGGKVTVAEITSGCPSSLVKGSVRVVQGGPVNPGDGLLPGTRAGTLGTGNWQASLISQSDEIGGGGEQSDASWGTYPGAFQVLMGMPLSVPGPCFGGTVGYHVTINVAPQPVAPR